MMTLWVISPSALPDISPTRGEIGKRHAQQFLNSRESDVPKRLDKRKRPMVERGLASSISPLVGEMSGRTEGGAAAHHLTTRCEWSNAHD